VARLLFTNANLFDGTGAPPAAADVVIEDGRIVEVGSSLDGDEAVDVGGRALLPGLFDTHVHVAVGHVDMWKLAHEPFSMQFYEAARNLSATLDAGITSIRDAGGADLGIKEAVARGMIRGPQMQVSISMLSQTGGHGDGWLASGGQVDLFVTHPGRPSGIVDGAEEMRHKVRELLRAGADVLKVATSGGVLSPRDDPTHAHFTLGELEVLVAEAAAGGAWVMAHAQGTDGIKNAIRAGIRSVEHGIYLDDEAIEMMLARGTFLVPTLVAPQGVVRAAEAGAPIPEVMVRKAETVVEAHRDSFARAVAAGVRVAMGTDSGVTPHGENLDELELMACGGMAPADVLKATTGDAAVLMGVEGERGTVEPGKTADLVVLDGDPFDFNGYRQRIRAVYQGGALVSGGL
jgi:imidazolonepropionase-like amidohydrolase